MVEIVFKVLHHGRPFGRNHGRIQLRLAAAGANAHQMDTFQLLQLLGQFGRGIGQGIAPPSQQREPSPHHIVKFLCAPLFNLNIGLNKHATHPLVLNRLTTVEHHAF